MKINVNKIDNLNAELSIELVAEDYNPAIEKKLKELRKEAQIPGFRKGMVPMSHIQRLFGKETKYRAVNELLWENLSNYLKENSTSILGEPLLNQDKSETIDVIDTKNSVQVVFDLGLKPEFEVNLSKKDKITYQKINITQELIDKEVENYSRRFGSFSDVEKTEENEMVVGKIKQLDSENQIIEEGVSVDDAYVSLEQIKNHKDLFLGKTPGEKIIFNPKKVFENPTEISNLLHISNEDAENLDCNFEL
ncbi:MAG TPA: trigger factor family protein, partial [Salinivirgaceae bacterium]|nr:trigger factor family protein [Salinivirgaceae bacterium]